MTSSLSEQKCRACEGLADKLTPAQIETNSKQLKDWDIINSHHLEKTYQFKDFKTTLEFINALAKVAEEQSHHPRIDFTWGEATVKWWTHKVHGLTMNDFIMAAKTDEILKEAN